MAEADTVVDGDEKSCHVTRVTATLHVVAASPFQKFVSSLTCKDN